jgi:hypothetical protein
MPRSLFKRKDVNARSIRLRSGLARANSSAQAQRIFFAFTRLLLGFSLRRPAYREFTWTCSPVLGPALWTQLRLACDILYPLVAATQAVANHTLRNRHDI